jgi:hypothetical protein
MGSRFQWANIARESLWPFGKCCLTTGRLQWPGFSLWWRQIEGMVIGLCGHDPQVNQGPRASPCWTYCTASGRRVWSWLGSQSYTHPFWDPQPWFSDRVPAYSTCGARYGCEVRNITPAQLTPLTRAGQAAIASKPPTPPQQLACLGCRDTPPIDIGPHHSHGPYVGALVLPPMLAP